MGRSSCSIRRKQECPYIVRYRILSSPPLKRWFRRASDIFSGRADRNSKPRPAIGKVKLKKLFEKANIADGHAHRFRDTFAVELLLANVPIERISILLGHPSIRITERHYTPWVRARQEQAEADVRGAWAQDPVALLETKGTPEVHGNSAAVN